ncbi:hypothetical protein FH972_018704 [Carpinus fangiana]|uniref:Aminotransferase class I/classII domain-containing protein n=1 Tax=Carpinus fangiana TaxID=176857 RepID=A0A5N6RRT4_9ROSI|nr:hypothetical protein FH972_018704 [Carpinus fangiana]
MAMLESIVGALLLMPLLTLILFIIFACKPWRLFFSSSSSRSRTIKSKRLLLFSGNDYLGLSSHPTIGNAAAKVRLMKGLAERYRSVEVFIYQHCDMSHLNELLSKCKMKRKVVVTDGLMEHLFVKKMGVE